MPCNKQQLDLESRSMEKYLEKGAAQEATAGISIGSTMDEPGSSHETFICELQKITAELTGLRQDYKSIDSLLNTREGKLEHIESFTLQLQTAVKANGCLEGLEGKINKVERLTKTLDTDLEDLMRILMLYKKLRRILIIL